MTVTVAMVADAVLADLRNRHAEPQRHYHTWDHIEALLRWFEARRNHLHDPLSVELAILFHDAAYDPTRSDNEAESARLLMDVDLPGLDELKASGMLDARPAGLITENSGLFELPDDEPLSDDDTGIPPPLEDDNS